LEIVYLKSVDSTHKYLKEYIKNNGYTEPLCVATQNQIAGVGSRDNSWDGEEGNLFFSFVIKKKDLPKDLPLQSASIYFSFILKDILKDNGSRVFLKWPNDFYINSKKIGGTITSISGDLIYCGIGLNLIYINSEYGYLDIDINTEEFLYNYFNTLGQFPQWKKIFSKFVIEFHNNKYLKTNIDNQQISLKDAKLQEDGSLLINGEKVFSLR